MDKMEVIKKVKNCFVQHKSIADLLSRMESLLEDHAMGGEPEHLMVIGDTGVGKSRLLQKFAKKFPPVHHDTYTELPVVYVEVPSNCTPKKLLSEILATMGSPFAGRGDASQLTRQLKTLVGQCKVRMVLLDEANHLVERGTNKSFFQMADALKELANTSNLTLVVAGVAQTRALIEANDQLRSRFRDVIELKAFSAETPAHEAQFKGVLDALQGLLGPYGGTALSEPMRARKLLHACGGRLRELRKLLVRAIQTASTRANCKLTESDLHTAFRAVIFPGAAPDRDPFHKDFSGYPLVKAGEPFAEARRT
jgi:Cdc6-like AAA superfamily ATPase